MPTSARWLLMVLPFALWGTAMTAMAPLLDGLDRWLVACLRVLPPESWCSSGWQGSGPLPGGSTAAIGLVCPFTLVDACLFQAVLARGLEQTGAGLGSVLIDSQPLMVALLARALFAESINPVGWMGLVSVWPGISVWGCLRTCCGIGGCSGAARGRGCWSHGELWMLAGGVGDGPGDGVDPLRLPPQRSGGTTGWHMLWSLSAAASLRGSAISACLPGAVSTGLASHGLRQPPGSALAYGLFFWFANRRDLTGFSSPDVS